MRVFYETDKINQLFNVKEIIINEGTIKFVIVRNLLEQEIDLQDFYFIKEFATVNICRTDGRVETISNLDNKEVIGFFIPENDCYLLGRQKIYKATTRSIHIDGTSITMTGTEYDKIFNKTESK